MAESWGWGGKLAVSLWKVMLSESGGDLSIHLDVRAWR